VRELEQTMNHLEALSILIGASIKTGTWNIPEHSTTLNNYNSTLNKTVLDRRFMTKNQNKQSDAV